MTKFSIALYLALGTGALVGASCAQAQTMPDMPGMPMAPPPPAKAAHTQKPSTARPNQKRTPADPMPGDLQGMQHDLHDPKARAAGRSEADSVHQQSGQGQADPGPGSDRQSITAPIQTLQEPEAVGFQTGADLPAPELLTAVVTRAPMRLEAFFALAEQHNPTLAQAQQDRDRSKAQARQAGLPPDPEIGYSGEHIRGGQYHGGEEGAFLSQEIVLGRKLALRRDVYRAEGEANQLAIEVQRARVHNDVAHAFFDTLAAQQAVVIQGRLLKVTEDAATNSHELERIGQADASDVLNAEIAAEQAKVDFESAQRLFLSSFAMLRSDAGGGDLEPHPLEGLLVEPPQLDAIAVVEKDVQTSPAVRQADASVKVAEARVRSASREKVPNLNLKAGEWYSGEVLDGGAGKAGWMSFAEAGVQLPLWNRNQGNTAAARAELQRAQAEVARTQLWTRSRAEPEAQAYASARFAAERYRDEMLPRARRAYQLEVTKYQQMAQTYPHVLAAQRTLFALQLGYVHALNQEWDHAIALENFTLMNALDRPTTEGEDSTTANRPTDVGGR